MREKYFNRIMDLVIEGGEIAMDLIDDSEPSLKSDESVLSKADTAVSKLIRKRLSDLLSTPDHILIDEEDEKAVSFLDQSKLEKPTYIWAVDPIDGTRNYANRIPIFGVSIGLLKNQIPWLGAVYFPYLKELFYCDGEQSYFVQEALTPNEKKMQIRSIEQDINSQSIFLCVETFFKHYKWDYKDCHIMIQTCAIADLCWPAIGRCCGSIFNSHLWDLAGSWPIFRSAGLNLRSLKDGQVMDKVRAELFHKDKTPWRFKEHYVLSTERNFTIIKSKLKSL